MDRKLARRGNLGGTNENSKTTLQLDEKKGMAS